MAGQTKAAIAKRIAELSVEEETYRGIFETRLEFPVAVMFTAPMQRGNIVKNLFEVDFRLLEPFTEKLDRPEFALSEDAKEHIEKLVPWHTRHAFELTLDTFLFGFLFVATVDGSTFMTQVKAAEVKKRTERSVNPTVLATPLESLLMPPCPPTPIPFSSKYFTCFTGLIAILVLSLTLFLYLSLSLGLKLHSCLILPVMIVVRALELTGGIVCDDEP